MISKLEILERQMKLAEAVVIACARELCRRPRPLWRQQEFEELLLAIENLDEATHRRWCEEMAIQGSGR